MSEVVEIIERTNKIINASGVVIEVENPNINYIVSESIPIIPSERLQITASGDYAHYIYAFYTVESVFISGLLAEAGGTVTEILAEEVVAPENAASMLIAYKKPKQGIVVRLDVTPSNGNIKMQKIENLPEATEINDTDISLLNTTTPQTKKFKIGTLLDYIIEKFKAWSFVLKTNNQTIPGAIDELKDGVDTLSANVVSRTPGKWEYKQITLTYNDATTLNGHFYFTGKVLCSIVTGVAKSGTPIATTNNIYVDQGYQGYTNLVQVYAKGTGYVSGHILAVNVLALVEIPQEG